jgi:hypothetical protein
VKLDKLDHLEQKETRVTKEYKVLLDLRAPKERKA